MGDMGKLSVSVCAVSKALGSAVYIEVSGGAAGTGRAGQCAENWTAPPICLS